MSRAKTWRGVYKSFHKRKKPHHAFLYGCTQDKMFSTYSAKSKRSGAYGCSINDATKTRKGTIFALMVKKAQTTEEKLEIIKQAMYEPLRRLLYAQKA